jgi:hypothetical protein
MIKEKIIDHATGKITYRDYTPEEMAACEIAEAEGLARLAEYEAKQAARASALAKLAALGLSADEIAAL